MAGNEVGLQRIAKPEAAIAWTEGRYGSHHGAIGQVQLFTASWATDRNTQGKPVVLRCGLPGFQSKTWQCESYSAAEAKAESVLARWLHLIGAARL